ncbi:MAG: hypothetical protein R2568_00105 [Candidatus Scalindua sp.]|nr:hypothetical protein [Candidatus Scalindua sp.]MDV5165134.1 hypothetical protein [Candidatus Scalindua sp.]
MIESENIMGIVVADKDGVIKLVSRTNGSLPSSLIGTKWYDAFSIPVEEIHIEEERNHEVFRLHESGEKLSVFPSYDQEGSILEFHILVEENGEGDSCTQSMNKVSCLGKIVPGIAHEIIILWRMYLDGYRCSMSKHKIRTPKRRPMKLLSVSLNV